MMRKNEFLSKKRMRQIGQRVKRMMGLGLAVCIVLGLAACGKEAGELPENNPANVGCYAIMETEEGYYTNYGIRKYLDRENVSGTESVMPQQLYYHDKETKDTILLCDKAECEHNGGDDCVATYKQVSVINSVLYQNAIYIYCTEENNGIIEFNLYKASLDGSSMDKVGCAFSVENTADKGFAREPDIAAEYCFIIHKGVAYLPYYARLGKTSSGFKGAGLVSMNLETGEKKTLYEVESLNSSMNYMALKYAAGDYLYFDSNSGFIYSRYSLKEDAMVPIYSVDKCTATDGDCRHPRVVHIATDQYLMEIEHGFFASQGEEQEDGGPIKVRVYDSETGCNLPEKDFELDVRTEEFDIYRDYMIYKDMAVIVTADRVLFYGLSEDNWGQKLGEMAYDFQGKEAKRDYYRNVIFKVENDKLYRLDKPFDKNFYGEWDDDLQAMVLWYDVYSCPVSDILEGKGEWSFAFSYDPDYGKGTE